MSDNHDKKWAEPLIESIYDLIKTNAGPNKILHSKHLFDIADLTTELANRIKVEEDCGEQEG